jgi:hypothetical protein
VVALFNDPGVLWAGKKAGGIRISAMSGLTRAQDFPVKINRTKVQIYRIEPIKIAPPDAIITQQVEAPSDPKAAIVGWLASKGIESDQLDRWLVNLGKQTIADMHPGECARLFAVLDSQEGKIRAA